MPGLSRKARNMKKLITQSCLQSEDQEDSVGEKKNENQEDSVGEKNCWRKKNGKVIACPA